MNISGGTIKGVVYEKGCPFMIVGGKGKTDKKIYLNPRIIPQEINPSLIGMEILLIEGEFSHSYELFFPTRLVIVNSACVSDYQLHFD